MVSKIMNQNVNESILHMAIFSSVPKVLVSGVSTFVYSANVDDIKIFDLRLAPTKYLRYARPTVDR